ncbi:hypothetical protein YYG_03901 [Plasmodium vinckei petteri]|uniref:Uncharacterized protein n=1 Tax=Plasmodium vinckei petteri TaxID=138298 RepID=W7AQB7_PLAVN|nr:hypothetical protein YYG_03901 [Plasmodium vinckei petteri]CAD2097465.1 conserved Plasmodium protein, unknown function [Plasmodium vinckei petteri]
MVPMRAHNVLKSCFEKVIGNSIGNNLLNNTSVRRFSHNNYYKGNNLFVDNPSFHYMNIEKEKCSKTNNPFLISSRNIVSSTSKKLNKNNYIENGSKEEDKFFEGEHLNRQLGGYGYPMMFIVTYDRPSWQPFWENDCDVIPRDEFGIPASIPPEVSTNIKHTYYVPPQFYMFLKKLGDDTAELKPYMTKLIQGEFTYDDYQEMFYKFAKPLKIFRKKIPVPYRSAEEMKHEENIKWQSAWYSYRQKVLAEYNVTMCLREFILYMTVGLYFAYLWLDALRQYRLDMKLFYLEAPEHKINWVKPRGDLV